MNGLEKRADHRFFVTREMRTQRMTQRLTNPIRWLNLAYELVCGYGYGFKRVVSWWVGNIAVGAVLLCASNIPQLTKDKTLLGATLEAFSDYHSALLAGFVNAHDFLNLEGRFFENEFGAAEWAWYDGVGTAQTVLGVIFLFFLLLTIRNLFRMR